MNTVILSLLLSASAVDSGAAADSASSGAKMTKTEKKICKRPAVTESRMGAKRVCKTAAQWKRDEVVSGDEDKAGVSTKAH